MNVVEGLIKVRLQVSVGTSARMQGNGYDKTITFATDGYNFMIPSKPAPARTSYTLTVYNGSSAIFAKYLYLGFGDDVLVECRSDYQPVYKYELNNTNNSVTQVRNDLNDKITYGNYDKTDGYSYLKSGCIYCYY